MDSSIQRRDHKMMRSVSARVVIDRVDGGEQGNTVVATSWRVNEGNASTGFSRGMGRVWDIFGWDSQIFRCFCFDFCAFEGEESRTSATPIRMLWRT